MCGEKRLFCPTLFSSSLPNPVWVDSSLARAGKGGITVRQNSVSGGVRRDGRARFLQGVDPRLYLSVLYNLLGAPVHLLSVLHPRTTAAGVAPTGLAFLEGVLPGHAEPGRNCRYQLPTWHWFIS